MKSDWLTAASFERAQGILTAINILSIHCKLAIAGVPDPTSDADVKAARQRLTAFLRRFQSVVHDARQEQGGTVLGADPQLGQLTARYLADERKGLRASALHSLSFAEVVDLVNSERADDLRELVEYLRDLRAFLEQYIQVDMPMFEDA
jgi:hypothetical protein